MAGAYEIVMQQRKDLVDMIIGSVCSTKPLPKSRTTLDTRGERLRCFEFDEMAGI